MTTLRSLLLVVALPLVLTLAGCARSDAAPDPGVGSRLAKVVFVGKTNACDCTRKTVDAGWAALQKALGAPAKLPVLQLQIDTEGEKVAPFGRQKPMVALPAIYFVDAKGGVIEMLQGEVTEAQIAALLERHLGPAAGRSG